MWAPGARHLRGYHGDCNTERYPSQPGLLAMCNHPLSILSSVIKPHPSFYLRWPQLFPPRVETLPILPGSVQISLHGTFPDPSPELLRYLFTYYSWHMPWSSLDCGLQSYYIPFIYLSSPRKTKTIPWSIWLGARRAKFAFWHLRKKTLVMKVWIDYLKSQFPVL